MLEVLKKLGISAAGTNARIVLNMEYKVKLGYTLYTKCWRILSKMFLRASLSNLTFNHVSLVWANWKNSVVAIAKYILNVQKIY